MACPLAAPSTARHCWPTATARSTASCQSRLVDRSSSLTCSLPPAPRHACVMAAAAGADSGTKYDPDPQPVAVNCGADQPCDAREVLSVSISGRISCSAIPMLVDFLGTLPLGSWGSGNGGSGWQDGNGGGGGGSDGGDGVWEVFRGAVAEGEEKEEEVEEVVVEEEEEEEHDFLKRYRQQLLEQPEEDEEDYVDPTQPFFCSEMVSEGLLKGPGIPREVDLFAGLNCQPGFRCTQAELKKDLQTLSHTEGIDKVEVRVTPIKGTAGQKCQVKFLFSSRRYPEMKTFATGDATALPRKVVDSIMENYQKGLKEGKAKENNMQTISLIRNTIEKWYHDRGYIMCYIKQFEGLDTGRVTARVVEGRVNKVKVVFVDDEGNEKKRGNATNEVMVRRELLFTQGMLYNQEDSRRALRDLIRTGLYENVQVLPEQTKKDEKKVDVTVMVKERPMQTTEIEWDWRLKTQHGIPVPESLLPGGTIVVDHRNLFRKGHSLTGTVTTSNILDPQDLGYRLEYKRPYIYGENDRNRTALAATAFNARKLSGVFTPGPTGSSVRPIFVHRAGAKVSVQQQYSCSSKGSFGFLAQEITSFDELGSVIARGFQTAHQVDGPPTTLGEGQDQQLLLQWDIVRDTTYTVNGAPIGARDVFQVDQGTGIGGFFNRYMLSLTRFMKLKESRGFRPPVALVLHARHGNTIGDIAAYDAHCLGGPFSVRGCNIGELATCRRYLEAAVELRMPTPFFNHQMYGFYEHGTDLGSSKDVPGNPTQYFRKPGAGSARGVGLKVGPLRVEYVQDMNMGKGVTLCTIGERF